MVADGSPLVIVGAGGHGQVVADILALTLGDTADRGGTPLAYADDDRALVGSSIDGVPVAGTISDLEYTPHRGLIVAIGDNRERSRVLERLSGSQRQQLVRAIHPSATIADSARIGDGVMICAGAIVGPLAEVGDGAILNTGCSVDHHCVVGRCGHIGPGAHLGGNVIVNEGALVGIGASVIPGAVVGEWSTVGAGAVVIRQVDPHARVAGNPAEPIGSDR